MLHMRHMLCITTGYCGDVKTTTPTDLAHAILVLGYKRPAFVDEIYLQLCKHMTLNPKETSVQRGWQLMCMCVGVFPPSKEFEDYLFNFILQTT